ncbi:MAG: hypothetical protein AAB445_03080, partial [Patescibacteria group bacterium]
LMSIAYVYGNADLEVDSLPIRIIPQLARARPDWHFEFRDPLDEWAEVPNPLVIIDTVRGLEKVQIFTDLTPFADAPRVSLHDLDLLAHLQLLQKLGKLKNLTLIGVPPSLTPDEAVRQISAALPSTSR